jgi:hypothetical protein
MACLESSGERRAVEQSGRMRRWSGWSREEERVVV